MEKLLQAYDNQNDNELAKQIQDEIFENHQRRLIEKLKGTLYLHKQGYGLLEFNRKDVMTDFKLEMGFKGQWAAVPCDEKKKIRQTFKQPIESKDHGVEYVDIDLSLSGLPASVPYSRMACNNIHTCFTNYCVCAAKELTKALVNHKENKKKWIALKKRIAHDAATKKESVTKTKRDRRATNHYSPPSKKSTNHSSLSPPEKRPRIDLTATSDNEQSTNISVQTSVVKKEPTDSRNPNANLRGKNEPNKKKGKSGKKKLMKLDPPSSPSARSHGATGGMVACKKPPQKKIKLSPSKSNPSRLPEDVVRDLEYQGQPVTSHGAVLLGRFVTIQRP